MPFDLRAVAPWPFFAWSVYAGARLTPRVAVPLVLAVVGLTDLILYRVYHLPPTVSFYPCLGLSLFMGWGLLRRSESLVGAAAASVCGYGVFFLVTNFVAWLEPDIARAVLADQPRAIATVFAPLGKAAPQFGVSLILSILIAVGIRRVSDSWKAISVGLAAAVVGGGLATVLFSAITGNSLS